MQLLGKKSHHWRCSGERSNKAWSLTIDLCWLFTLAANTFLSIRAETSSSFFFFYLQLLLSYSRATANISLTTVTVIIGEHILYRISYRLIPYLPLNGVWTQSKWDPHPIHQYIFYGIPYWLTLHPLLDGCGHNPSGIHTPSNRVDTVSHGRYVHLILLLLLRASFHLFYNLFVDWIMLFWHSSPRTSG